MSKIKRSQLRIDYIDSAKTLFMQSVIKFKGYFLSIIVFLIMFLLVCNIYLIYKYSVVIETSRLLQEQAEKIKVNTLDILRNLHLVDLGLRGYALVRTNESRIAMENAFKNKVNTFNSLESSLKSQHYPMETFYSFKDSVENYFTFILTMKQYVDDGRREEFLQQLAGDAGYKIWLTYRRFSGNVYLFEDKVSSTAKINYSKALINSFLLQILLFIIAMPTLIYTAYYTNRTLSISNQLRKAEEERNKLLSDQNFTLELMVKERTDEILSQNEEIAAHNEQLLLQRHEIESQRSVLAQRNEDLLSAQNIIEQQNNLIKLKNTQLISEVDKRTEDLKRTNLELIEQNSRLEQFTYIISHNLRAPMTRLVGLSSILEFTKDEIERAQIIQLMIRSTTEFDKVIKDLSLILSIKKINTHFTEVSIMQLVDKVVSMLEEEIAMAKVSITKDFGDVKTVYSLPQYLESIFYNLISNAIKYRDPVRPLTIRISTRSENENIRLEVADNGLGIDLEKYKKNLFNLYKRFHFHVEGKGMGLYLVKTQVEGLGAKIDVQSEVNKGTIFSILLKKMQ